MTSLPNHKIESTKTKEAILNIFDDSVLRLAKALYEQAEPFVSKCQSAVFSSIHSTDHHPVHFSHYIEIITGIEGLAELKNNINEYTKDIVLKYKFTYTNELKKPLYYTMSIKVKFLNGHYSVISEDKISNLLLEDQELREKKYSQQLMDTEIQELVQVEVDKHKIFLEDKKI